jgi:hypothetical protein
MFVQMQAVGKVERDPELVVTKGGVPFTEFPLAVNTKRCVEDITIWLTCSAWGDEAETIQRSVTKGALLFVRRVVLSVWGSLERCPGHAALVRALEGHLASAAASAIRSFFALGEASEVRSLFAGGPFDEVQLLTAVRTVRFASPEQFVRIEMIPSHPESPLAGMDERFLSVVISEVNAALQPYVGPDGLAFPMQAHLVTARK